MGYLGTYRDLYGQVFGRITVGGAYCKYPREKYLTVRFDSACNCGGNIFGQPSATILRMKTPSCGCWKEESHLARVTKHGKSGSKLYQIWELARQRCRNPKQSKYHNYGGRGITFSEEFDDFEVYESYLLELHPNALELLNKGHQIDRIDNDKGYERGNLRIVTPSENYNNTRVNRRVEVFGVSYTIAEVLRSPLCLVIREAVIHRLSKGYSDHEAVLLPGLPKMGRGGYPTWHQRNFPNDITLEEALAPVYLNNPGYGPLDS